MRRATPIVILVLIVAVCSCAKSPSMVVTPSEMDLGIVRAHDHIDLTTWVYNNGKGPLVVSTRPLCDCIKIFTDLPDTIAPGDSAKLGFTFIVPAKDTITEYRASIAINSNDKKNKVAKVTVKCVIERARVSSKDSTIALLPPTEQLPPELQSVVNKINNNLLKLLAKKVGVKPVSSNKLMDDLITDPLLQKRVIDESIRKWALLDSIRWVFIYQFIPRRDGKVGINYLLVDALLEFPIIGRLTVSPEHALDSLVSSLVGVFKNYRQSVRQSTIYGLQVRMQKLRSRIINSPAPKVRFVDVRTKDTVNLRDFKGKTILMHFFSFSCEHCEEEIDWLSKLNLSKPSELDIVGVSVDIGEEDSVKKFIDSKGVTYRVLMPIKEDLPVLEHIYGGMTPQTIIIDKKGIVREYLVGYNKLIIAALEKKLNEVMTGKKQSQE